MLELLRSLEWQAGYNGHVCPSCRACEVDGHAPGCRLGRAIRELAEKQRHHEQMLADIEAGLFPSAPNMTAEEALRELASEPTVDEMAREMGLWRCSGCSMSWNSKGEPVIDVAALYREHKARQVDATIAGKRVGPWLTPPAPKVYEASGPPTDPSALAAWLYARVVPGQTRAVAGSEEFVVLTKATHRTGGFTVAGARAEPASYPAHAMRRPITRLLNPDGTVLWEAK